MLSRAAVIERLTVVYSAAFRGQVAAGWEPVKRKYYIHGEQLPPNPKLRHLYPNGWSLLDYLTPAEARRIAGDRGRRT